MLAALYLAATLSSAVPAGEWLHVLPGAGQVLGMVSDSMGSIYIKPRGLVRHSDGEWDSIPFPMEVALLTGSREYWAVRYEYGPTGGSSDRKGSLVHSRDGVSTVYDTANSCLEGNLFQILGRDEMGRLIVDQRFFYGLGGPSTGVVRFDGNTCEPIGLGLHGEWGATAYFSEGAGREYFSTRMISDVVSCGEILRLEKGKLDTLAEGACITKFAARGEEIWGAAHSGAWIISNGSARRLSRILGRELPGVNDILSDSRGVLWLGTEGYDFFPENFGLVAISGKDTVLYNRDNSGFPAYFASALAEDEKGNIWVGTWDKGVAVFARDKSVLSLDRPREKNVMRRTRGRPGSRHDLLGRRQPDKASPLPAAWISPVPFR